MTENQELDRKYSLVSSTLRKLIAGETPSQKDFVSAMSTVAGLFSRRGLYGESEALASRLVWSFPTGHVFWYAADVNLCVLSHMTEEYKNDSLLNIGIMSALIDNHESMDFRLYCNGWEFPSPADISAVVNALESDLGEAKMFIPLAHEFEYNIENYISNEDDGMEFLERLEIIEEDDESSKVAAGKAIFEFLVQTYEEGLTELSTELWSATFVHGDEMMPKFSGTERFHRFLMDLETRGWLVLEEQCCDSCARESRELELMSDPGKVNSPVFVTWEQNAESSWANNGAICHRTYLNPDNLNTVRLVAQKNGLTVEAGEIKDEQLHVAIVVEGDSEHMFDSRSDLA